MCCCSCCPREEFCSRWLNVHAIWFTWRWMERSVRIIKFIAAIINPSKSLPWTRWICVCAPCYMMYCATDLLFAQTKSVEWPMLNVKEWRKNLMNLVRWTYKRIDRDKHLHFAFQGQEPVGSSVSLARLRIQRANKNPSSRSFGKLNWRDLCIRIQAAWLLAAVWKERCSVILSYGRIKRRQFFFFCTIVICTSWHVISHGVLEKRLGWELETSARSQKRVQPP